MTAQENKKAAHLLVGWVDDSSQKIVSQRIKPYKSETRFDVYKQLVKGQVKSEKVT